MLWCSQGTHGSQSGEKLREHFRLPDLGWAGLEEVGSELYLDVVARGRWEVRGFQGLMGRENPRGMWP